MIRNSQQSGVTNYLSFCEVPPSLTGVVSKKADWRSETSILTGQSRVPTPHTPSVSGSHKNCLCRDTLGRLNYHPTRQMVLSFLAGMVSKDDHENDIYKNQILMKSYSKYPRYIKNHLLCSKPEDISY